MFYPSMTMGFVFSWMTGCHLFAMWQCTTPSITWRWEEWPNGPTRKHAHWKDTYVTIQKYCVVHCQDKRSPDTTKCNISWSKCTMAMTETSYKYVIKYIFEELRYLRGCFNILLLDDAFCNCVNLPSSKLKMCWCQGALALILLTAFRQQNI